MWIIVIFILATFSAGDAIDYNNASKELLSKFHSMIDTPLSKDTGKLSRFKEELAEFSKMVVPLAEHFAKSLNEGKHRTTPMCDITSDIRETITYSMSMMYLPAASGYFRLYKEHFDEWATRRLKAILLKLEMISIDTRKLDQLDIDLCRKYPADINRVLDQFSGKKCLDLKFSPKVVILLNELIKSCKLASNTLTEEEEEEFNSLYSELYHYLDKNSTIGLSSSEVKTFLREKKDHVYDDKVKLLADLSNHLGLRSIGEMISECLPMAAVVRYHFDNDVWLQIGDVVISHVFASNLVTRICANITHYGDPQAAKRFVDDADKELKDVYSVLTEWLPSLIEITRSTTETE